MSVLNCIATMAAAGKITPRQREEAENLYKGIVGRLYETMPRASAEAQAAVETARILEEGAKKRRYALAKDAIAYRSGLDRIQAHPNGPIAGYMSILSRDIRADSGSEAGRVNVESLAKDYEGRMAQAMQKTVKAYGSRLAGLSQNVAGIRDMIREIFGVDTRNEVAKIAAKGWSDGVDKFSTDLATKMGKVFSPAEDWRLPQFWETDRVRKFGRGAFLSDLRQEIASGGLRVFDPDTGEEANPIRREQILSAAAQKIAEDASFGVTHGGAFASDMRIFRFAGGRAGADAYLRLMDKYGAGQGGYLQMMQAHVQKVSRDLALTHVLGPGWRANGEALLREAVKRDATRQVEASERAAPQTLGEWFSRAGEKAGNATLGFLESPTKAEQLWKYMSGQSSGAQSTLIANVFSGLRSWMTAANMGSAMLTAVPSDSVNWKMAASHVGMDQGRLAARIVDAFKGGKTLDDAAHLGIASHAAIDSALATKRFSDQFFGERLMSRMADFVIRAQGLHAWDSALKAAFPLEMLGTIASRAGTAFDGLDTPFKSFLEHYRFTPEDWKILSDPANHVDVGGARYVLPDSIEKADPALRSKLMSAIYDERQFAYLAEGSARVRATTTGGNKAGTLAGELTRSAFLFKSFPMQLLSTWGMRAAIDGGWQGRLAIASQLGIYLTFAGALSMQARQLLQGKDPRDMRDPWFWAESAMQGGALGIYGDFFREAFSRADTSLTESLLGPLAQIPSAVQGLTSQARRVAQDGSHANFGSQLARDIRNFTPGSTLWYTRLLANRFVFDQIERQINPRYADSFRRQERALMKTTHTGFWWSPGQESPERGPDLGNAVR